MKATADQANVLYTCLPFSLCSLPTSTSLQNKSITVSQNFFVKMLPDGKYVLVGSNEFTQNQNVIVKAQGNESASSANVLPKQNAIQINDGCTSARSVRSNYVENVNASDIAPVNNNTAADDTKNNKSKSNLDYLKCDMCEEMFNKRYNYRKHLQLHRNTKKYKCDECFESYNVEDNLKIHKAIHKRGQPTCPLCNRNFQRLASFKSHLLLHQVEDTYTCKECLSEFENEDEYHRHVEDHNDETFNSSENIPYICTYCNYLFEDAKEYKEHVSYHVKIKKLVLRSKKARRRRHINKDYPHKCNICKKSFPKSCLLERHNRIHTGERPFACDKCDKAFTQKGTLQIHLFKHTGVKPYKCTLCPAEYFQKGNLRVHVEKTHTAPRSGEKLYKCSECTCVFRKVASLNAHMTKVHGGARRVEEVSISTLQEQLKELQQISCGANISTTVVNSTPPVTKTGIGAGDISIEDTNPFETFVKLADSSIDGTLRRYLVKQRRVGDIKWFICSYCGKECKKPSDLIRHIRIHTREKPYKCVRCLQSFALKSTLMSHLNTHFTKRDHQCVHCLKMFTSARTLKVHYRKHDKGPPRQTLHFKCSSCSRLFNSLAKVNHHMTIHETGSTVVNTDPNSNLNYMHHFVMKQPILETANGLLPLPAPKPKIPMADMEEYKDRPYKCYICNAAFTKPVHVKRHMLIHSGEKNYKCDICPNAFSTSYALKQHSQIHSVVKNFLCKLCGKRFSTNVLSKRHMVKHSSVRPYICPYCRKRFKTLVMCRKHINIHRRDVNIQVQALIETGEAADLVNTDVAKIMDLSDSISENPFGLGTTQIPINAPQVSSNSTQATINATQTPISVTQTSDNNLPLNGKQVDVSECVKVVPNSNVAKGNKRVPRKSKLISRRTKKNKSISSQPNPRSALLQGDGNISAVNENVNNLQERFSQELINQLTSNAQLYVDKSGNYSVTTAVNGLEENVEFAQNSQDEDLLPYSTIYISYDELQSINPNFYNSLLPQIKLGSNDPILMSAINEPQDSNILFMDPTLTQSAEFQNDAQNFESFNPVMFNSNISINDLSLNPNSLNISLPISTASINEQICKSGEPVLPSENGIYGKAKQNRSPVKCNNNMPAGDNNLNDNLIITLDNDDLKTNDLNYLSNINFNLAQSEIDSINLNSILISVPEEADQSFSCTICKSVFNAVDSLQQHRCVDISTLVKDVKKEIATDCNFSRAAVNESLRYAEGDGDTAVIPDFNDQLQTTHVEVSSEEPFVDVKADRVKPNNVKGGHKCLHCEKTFTNKVKLQKHVGVHKDTKVENRCPFCCKTFKKPSDMTRHVRTHTGEKPFSCDMCDKTFSLKSTLQSHLRTHNPSGNKKFNCGVCNTNLSCKSSLKTHMLLHTGVRPYQCQLCSSKFRTSAHRKSHFTNHYKDSANQRSTEHKTKRLNAAKLIGNYAAMMLEPESSKEQGKVLQDAANQSGVVLSTVQSGIQVLEPVESLNINEPIPMDLLQQLQSSGLLLEDSTVDVFPSSLIQLEVDSLAEKQVMNLRTIEEQNMNSLPSTTRNLATSGDFLPPKERSKSKDFECDTCHRKYMSRAVLRKHQKIHRQGHKCPKCGKQFLSEDLLTKHVKLHLGYRPFSCLLCANSFSEEGSLKTHMKRIHNAM